MKIADPIVKACPKCGSERTVFEFRNLFESILAIGSPLKKYRCRDCGKAFQAADRRRFRRENNTVDPS